MSAQLLLIGGGHAHLCVLEALARRTRSGIDVTLVSEHDSQFYSGMMPGHLAGHYTLEECSVPLDPVAETAQADFVRARVIGLDLEQRVAITEAGGILPFDVVSIDIGPAANSGLIPGLQHALPVRPADRLMDTWRTLELRFSGTPLSQTVAVIGGGAAGTEIALALAYRAQQSDVLLKLTLVTGRPGLLPGFPAKARRLMAQRLTALGVRVLEAQVEAVQPNSVAVRGAGEFYADQIIAAVGTAPHDWPAQAGLQCDAQGFIAVNRHLQSVSHPFVFAAGDCASMQGRPHPKSGVYAVRAGAPLAENLMRALTKRRLVSYRPQRLALYLLSAGGQDAVGVWGPLVVEGDWVWRWKDRIDRQFVRRFNPRA